MSSLEQVRGASYGITSTAEQQPPRQEKAVSTLIDTECCRCSALSLGAAATFAAAAIILSALSLACPAVAPILLMMGLVFLGLELISGGAAIGFLVGDCYFLLNRNACKRLVNDIKGRQDTNGISYTKLREWLQNPFAPVGDFLADTPAVEAFRELLYEENKNAKKISDQFTKAERELIDPDDIDDLLSNDEFGDFTEPLVE